MDNAIVYKDGVSRLMTLVKDTYGKKINAYYEGDPGIIPKAAFPCVIIEKEDGDITFDSTGHDRITENIAIRLVLDKTDDLGQDDDVDLTERKLRELVEARDPSSGFFLQGTLMYALRTHITLDNLTSNNDQTIQYGIIDRTSSQGRQVTSEARISVTLTERIQVPNRY